MIERIRKLLAGDGEPDTAPARAVRERVGYPPTMIEIADLRARQRLVFDPALKQYDNAYRAADPRFLQPGLAAGWSDARRHAMDLVLAAVAGSPWVDHLVLRGSVLLRAWFGDAAREPGDLDFVVVPQDWGIEEERTAQMLHGIARAAESAAERDGGPVRIHAGKAVSDDIWTYERVPGRRLVLPWTAEGLPGGVVQLDFVFNESLPVDAEPTLVPGRPGTPGALVNAATPELSLAWKLMWLLSDCYPQGKDLYDATLLAEHCELRYGVLRDVFSDADEYDRLRPVVPATVGKLAGTVEWGHFAEEYPDVPGGEAHYVDRLATALAPTFRPADRLIRTWMQPWIEDYRALLRRDGMHAVQQRMSGELAPAVAILATRELLGPADHGLDDARDVVLADPAWSDSARRQYIGDRQWLDEQLADFSG